VGAGILIPVQEQVVRRQVHGVADRHETAECVVAGDQRAYIVALITLDEEAFARWKQRRGKPAGATIGELRDDPDLCAVVQQAVDRANAAVSRPETIKRFSILPGQFQVGAELTPTGKVRRDYVLAKYASDIDALYAPGGPAVPPGSR
jgi:long-chain acyl-CoA synthetase